MNGLPISACWFALVAGLTGAIFATPDPGETEFRTTLRITAFTSAIPFLLAFCAAPLQRRYPSALSRWAMRNRRYLGLSVAGSHLIHLIAIIGLVETAMNPVPIGAVTRIAGGGGLVMIALMALTSNDLSVQILGPAWRRLHVFGLWLLWVDFIFTYSGTVFSVPLHTVMTIVFLAAAALRLSASRATHPA